MPSLDKIVIQNFRNISLQELSFSPNINCISGGNGEGKTNLLDAIHYLSMTKSAFSTADSFNFRHGTGSFAISGSYSLTEGRSTRINIRVIEGHEKKLTRDDKVIERLSSHIGLIPVVMVSPGDAGMVSDSGEFRRRFLNSVLSQMSAGYLSRMQQYNRILAQRNSLLKEDKSDDCLIDVLDGQLSALAGPISKDRQALSEQLNITVNDYYSRISGASEKVGVSYRSDLEKGELSDLLRAGRERDRMLRYTGAGIQRDDLVFTMDGLPIRRFGSQGQQKSFLVALKFAQYKVMSEMDSAVKPILLLDDLFDKLDMYRVQNLLEMVASDSFGQIFITDSNKVRMHDSVDAITSDRAYFETLQGTFTRADE